MDGLDLVYTDAAKVPQGVLTGTKLDLAFGEENSFEIVAPSRYSLETGAFVCVNGTEYGGIVDELATSGDTGTFTWRGRTFHGMLATKVIRPPSGSSHYRVSGEANGCIRSVLASIGLDDVMRASGSSSGITVPAYDFDRYCNAYAGICKMLSRVGARLDISWEDGVPVLSAVAAQVISLDTDRYPIRVTDVRRPVNHLICLGMGELAERTVIDLYADSSGNVSTTQTFFGFEEVCEVYDYPNAEDDELLADGTELLESYQQTSSVDLAIDALGDIAHVGDYIEAFDPQTGAAVRAEVMKKVVKTRGMHLDVTYETGEASRSYSQGGASGGGGGHGSGGIAYSAGEGITISSGVISADVTQSELDAVSAAAASANSAAVRAAGAAAAAQATADAHVASITAIPISYVDGLEI